MNLFYNPTIDQKSKEIAFDKEESRHIGKVLRKNEGDILHITDGKGYFYEARLTNTNAKQCIATIIKTEKQEPIPYHLHLAVAPTKLNDRYEWFLEKATEIGISEITPLICDHSERKVVKPERYEKIIQSAMKQSLKAYLPILNPAIAFRDFMDKTHSEKSKLIAHCEESTKISIKSIDDKKSYLILIGPEGDFSKKEILLSGEKKFIPITLGKSRLRTETAAIISCHSIFFNFIN